MAFFDMPLDELETYRPQREEPDDFDDFWARTIVAARNGAAEARFTAIDIGYSELDISDVEFDGFGGHPIKGWFVAPKRITEPLPAVVSFLGYGGGRGLAGSWSQLPSAGIAQFVMDTRGQGSGYRPGDTPDGAASGPRTGGVMTLGIQSPADYYYRRVFTDAVLAVDAARQHPRVDPSRIVVQGGSQGGGIALAAAALSGSLAGAVIDVPFLCGFRRAVGLVDTHPYAEIAQYLQIHRGSETRVFDTLAYFDGINFAARATAPALFSVGLMDQVCPPSTVYAARNHYAGPSRMAVYPYNGHENGEEFQAQLTVDFIRERVGL